MKAKHPRQPVVRDKQGVARFKGNQIVDDLLHGGCVLDMNLISIRVQEKQYAKADYTQFLQLLGGSLGRCGEDELFNKKVLDEAYDELDAKKKRK